MNRNWILITAVTIFTFFCCGSERKTAETTDSAENPGFNHYYTETLKAERSGDKAVFLENAEKLFEIAPRHPNSVYLYASALMQNDKHFKALALLYEIPEMGGVMDLANDSTFIEIRSTTEYWAIVEMIENNRMPVIGGEIVYTLPEADFYPEGITYDPVNEDIFAGSLSKQQILRIDRSGGFSNFIKSNTDSLWSFIGLNVDSERRLLWACIALTKRGPVLEGFKERNYGRSGVLKFDLETGILIKSYLLGNRPDIHLLNDLVISGSGDLFITDTETGNIYTINSITDELELYAVIPEFLNGITYNKDKNLLYAAASSGVFTVNLNTKETGRLELANNISLASADGLYYYENSLIAIQNSAVFDRIARFYLNETGDFVESCETLNAHFPENRLPTTGVIVDGCLYVVATGLWPPYNQGPPESPVILRIGL